MEDLKRRFQEHMERDEEMFKGIGASLVDIKDNHLAHIEPDMVEVKTNLKWIMGIGGAVGMVLLTALVGLYFK